MADKFVRPKDNNDIPINPASEESLQRLIAKLPVGLQTDGSNRLKVLVDASTTIPMNEYLYTSASSKLFNFDGIQFTNMRWQNQRGLLNL